MAYVYFFPPEILRVNHQTIYKKLQILGILNPTRKSHHKKKLELQTINIHYKNLPL